MRNPSSPLQRPSRHQLGQYFTPSHVAALLAAFAIRAPEDLVMDPACGDGSLLLAALERKRALGASPQGCLDSLWGLELDPAAAQLSSLALAQAASLADSASPHVLLRDFFLVRPGQVPAGFDALVGNPPFISYRRQSNQRHVSEALRALGQQLTLPRFSGKSDAYVWFIVHATQFLRPGGRLAFVLSSAVLFADYAIPLIRFIGQHYRIHALIDSRVERWFPEADTNTVLLLLEREPHPQAREENVIRFIRLGQPLAQLLHPGPERLLHTLLSAPEGHSAPGALVHSVRQGSEGGLEALHTRGLASGVHRRWGELQRAEPYIQALIAQGLQRGSLVPLRTLATVRGGVVTRANPFFLLQELPPSEGEEHSHLVLVRDGLGTPHRLERAWLRPALKGPEALLSPAEVADTPARLLVVEASQEQLRQQRATGVLAYLQRGETVPYKVSEDSLKGGVPAQRSNIRHRKPFWYSLAIPPASGPRLVMPEHVDRRYVASLLPEGHPAVVIDKLFVLHPRQAVYTPLLLASLNSLLTWYQLELRGRTQLGQGVLELKVADLEGLAVANPEALPEQELRALLGAFSALAHAREPVSLEAAARPERVAFDSLYLRQVGSHSPEEDRLQVERELSAVASERQQRRLAAPLPA